MNEEKKRYTQKEKMHHLAQKSKKGAKDNNGIELSDFQRGRNFGRSEEIGRQLGRHKYKQAQRVGDTATLALMEMESAQRRAKRDRERAAYKAEKAAQKAAKKGVKK